MDEHVARMGVMKEAYKILIRKSERKRPVRRLNLDEGILLKWI
jgi:hypothetical protein